MYLFERILEKDTGDVLILLLIGIYLLLKNHIFHFYKIFSIIFDSFYSEKSIEI